MRELPIPPRKFCRNRNGIDTKTKRETPLRGHAAVVGKERSASLVKIALAMLMLGCYQIEEPIVS
jgi:hypothetical protein